MHPASTPRLRVRNGWHDTVTLAAPATPLPDTHRPRKNLGQHFLTDASVVARIVSAFGKSHGRQVLEIGAGHGALTDALVTVPDARLCAVELDAELARRLADRHPQIKTIHGDILSVNLADIADDNPEDKSDRRIRLIGNLPYNISTPLLFHLLGQMEYVHDMLFMLQREVAARLAASPGGKVYGRLTVMAAVALDCEMLFDIPPQAFTPPPKVTSTLLRLTPKQPALTIRDRQVFNAVVKAAFGNRRKTLRNALAQLAAPEHFIRADIDPSRRAETLSVAQFITLADVLGE